MRLVTFRQDGIGRLAVERPDGRLLPTSGLGGSLPTTIEALVAGGPRALADLGVAVAAAGVSVASIDPASVEIMAPLPRPGKLVAVGLNYYDHAREGGAEPPAEPMLFAKFTTSVVGPGATIEWDPALTHVRRHGGGAGRGHRAHSPARVGS